jgi:hypothetical protein
MSEIEVGEGEVETIDGVRVGVANLWEREYALADGSTREGPSVMLYLDDGRDFAAGEGTEFDIGNRRWRVTAVVPGDPRGAIRLGEVT